MDRIFKLPVGVAIFAALALAGMIGILAVGSAQSAEAQELGDNAKLMSLSVTHGLTTVTLTPGFNPNIYNYNGSVPNSVAMVNVVATPSDDQAIVTGDGTIDLSAGNNFIDITVTAEDNDTEQTYTVIIAREPESENAELKSLTIVEGGTTTAVAIDPEFMAETTEYMAEVAYAVETINLKVEAADSNAKMVAIAAEDEDGSAISTAPTPAASSGSDLDTLNSLVTLDRAETEDKVTKITVTVTAEDSETMEEYVVEVTVKAKSNNANLRTLRVFRVPESSSRRVNIPVTPRFRAGTQFYTAEVANSVGEVTVTAVAADSNVISIAIGATGAGSSDSAVAESPVVASSESSEITLATATTTSSVTTVTITVMAEDNTSSKLYTVVIRRMSPSNNADLKALSFSHGTGDGETDIPLTPRFTAGTQFYTAKVANMVQEITVMGQKAHDQAVNPTYVPISDSDADVTGHQVELVDADTSPSFTTVTISVAAEDTSTKMYTVVIQRMAASHNADLKSLSFSHGTGTVAIMPAFDKETMNYSAEVPYSVTGVTVMAMPDHEYADVQVLDAEDGMVSLREGGNPIMITVTSDDAMMVVANPNSNPPVAARPAVQTYTVRITRLSQSTDATLSELNLWDGTDEVGDLSTSFVPGTMSYTVMVGNDVESVTVAATPAAGASFMVNGRASRDVDLMVGDNTITVKVTAEDGTTMMTYTITVTRAAMVDQEVTRDEVIAAIMAYLADDTDALTRDQLIALISRYLAQ